MVSKDTYWNQCASKRGRKKLKFSNLGIPEVLTICQHFPCTENGTEGKSEKCWDSWCRKIINTIEAIQVSIYLTGKVWLDSIWLYITQSHLTHFSLGFRVETTHSFFKFLPDYVVGFTLTIAKESYKMLLQRQHLPAGWPLMWSINLHTSWVSW